MVPGAPAIDAVPLETWIGPCQVVEARVGPRGRVRLEDLAEPPAAPRLLVKTGTFHDRERFAGDFAGLDPSLAAGARGPGRRPRRDRHPVRRPFRGRGVRGAPRARHAAGIAWLEGLVLAHVTAGLYDLVALPLRIEGGDGSPVRAVLVAR